MQSTFNVQTGEWTIEWPGRVAQHDVVYLSPPDDPLQGLPIGNGDIGVLAWCEGSRLIMAVNKCDLWDAAPFTRFHNWAADEEDHNSALRHACRIMIDFGQPVFDVFYLADFEARLSLADASLHLQASGPFGSLALRAFVAHDEGVICCEVTNDLLDAPAAQISVERYGSRTFGHWYALVNRDPNIGLGGTAASCTEDGMYLQQQLTEGQFGVGCRVIAQEPVTYTRAHTQTTMAFTQARTFAIIATVTSPQAATPEATARQNLDTAQADGIQALYAAHAQAWKAFWLRSYMSSGDDYLDNLWHLTLYYAAASQRGKYPGRFINGLWNWNRDVQNWTFYFHWNQQELYWPLNAAGHHELVLPYLEYRFASLPHAKEDAEELFHTRGAWVSDVSDFRGYNSLSELDNHTPVAQIALDFWRQYQYTHDATFLRERALPYLVEAATFFESLFELDADGQYHARSGTGYEGWIRLHDAITEIASARALFTAALDAAQECPANPVSADQITRWQQLLSQLTPLPELVPSGCFEPQGSGYRFVRGPYKDHPANVDRVYAAGFGIQEGRWLSSKVAGAIPQQSAPDVYTLLQRLEANNSPYSLIQEDMQGFDGIFPSVEISPIFPAGLIDVSSRGSDAYELAVNTVKLYAPDVMGWDTVPIVMARLGLAQELVETLQRFPSRWQFYCNGFGHYGPRDVMKADGVLRFRTSQVMDAALPAETRAGQKFPMPMWPFRHMGMESMSVLACSMNEALMQSHTGVIYLAPAVTDEQYARFTLHATGGFVVSAEVERGQVKWAYIVSTLGGTCRLANPWAECCVYRNDELLFSSNARSLEIATNAGDRIVCLPAGESLADWQTLPETVTPNTQPKRCPSGIATLGLARMY
jgi:hypothetical protein